MRNRLSESSFTALNPSFPVLLSPKSASYDLAKIQRFYEVTNYGQLSMFLHIIGPRLFSWRLRDLWRHHGDSGDLWRHHGGGIGLLPSSSRFEYDLTGLSTHCHSVTVLFSFKI